MLKARSRLRRTNNSAATLVLGQVNFVGVNASCLLSGVVTLAQGDTLELQAWYLSNDGAQFGKSFGSDGEAEIYSMIEFERQ
jgi:hypothetical protein